MVREKGLVIVGLLPAELPAPRFLASVQSATPRNPELARAERQSLMTAVLDGASLGLPRDGAGGQAHLVIDRRGRVKLLIGARGVLSIGERRGFSIWSGVVRGGDSFAYERGTVPPLHHTPALDKPARRR
jgi:recombinational DNA repair protein RecT